MWRGARILYVESWTTSSSSPKPMEQALHLRQRLASLLDALGLQRNPTKGFWEPCQFGRHQGVDIDSASGMFYAPAHKLNRLSRQATRLIGRATRNARWLPVRELHSLARQAQYLFRAIPAARFFLRELHSVVGDRLEARGFWSSADERQHITWKELKAVRLAVESFLPHLAGRNVLMHEDNQACRSCDRVAQRRRWEGKAWHHALTEMAVEELTVAPRAGLFRLGRQDGQASSLQPYMSAVNNFFKDHGREPMALGDLVSKVRKGLAASQVMLNPDLMRAPLPAGVVLKALTLAKALWLEMGPTWGTDPSTLVRVELFRARLAVVVLCLFSCRGGAGVECRTADLTVGPDGGILLYHRNRKGQRGADASKKLLCQLPASAHAL
eukprot:jgi/Tetstr1/445377/TSEL_003390.t1